MKKLLFSNSSNVEINVYADKSGSILEWLLTKGITKNNFSLSEVLRDLGISIGLIQKVFKQLVYYGYLKTEGLGTAKRFSVAKPKSLLLSWSESYNITKKCKMWNYGSAYKGRKELLDILKKSNLIDKVIVALHSSAEMMKCKNTNLETLELYVPDLKKKTLIEKVLCLEPQQRGYDILLIEPYYKHMIDSCITRDELSHTRPILTYLDLLYFPLRGVEQAEYIAENTKEIKTIFERGDS